MHFVIDAGLPHSLVQLLRDANHDGTHVRDIGLAHAADEIIAAYARERGLPLLTADFDFGDIRNYPPEENMGLVILVLPRKRNAEIIAAIVREFLLRLPTIGDLQRKLVIFDGKRVRIRD